MSEKDSQTPPLGLEPSPPAEEPNVRILQRIIFGACLVVLLAGIKAASTLLVPILLGCFLAIITWPLVALVRRTRLPDAIGIVAVLLFISGIIVGVGAAVVGSASGFIRESDKYSAALTERFGGLIQKLSQYVGDFGYEFQVNQLQSILDPGMLFGQLSTVLSSVGTAVSNVFYVLILLSFIIVEMSILPKKLQMMTTSEGNMRRFGVVIAKIQTYILVKTGLSIATAGITGIVTFAVGVPYAGLWMLLTFVLNFVPAFGSILAAIPPILLALLLVSWPAALAVALVYLAVNLIVDNLLEPRLMGRTLGLSPLVVFVSLVFWGWLLGPIGMPLSTPLTMVVKIMLGDSKQFGWVAILLGNGDNEATTSPDPHEQIPAMRFVSTGIHVRPLTLDPDATYDPSALRSREGVDADARDRNGWPDEPSS